MVGETWDLAGSFTTDEQALFDWVEDLDFVRYPTTALAWLAQREREAAAECIESRRLAQRFEERLIPTPSVEYAVTEVLAAEAAALRAGKGVKDAE